MKTKLVPILAVVFSLASWVSVAAVDSRPLFFMLFWAGLVLSFVTAVVGVLHTGAVRALFILGGLLAGVGALSFRVMPLGAINLPGFGGEVFGLLLIGVGLVLSTRATRPAPHA
ncbi:hypothetical protein ACGE24_04760 [Corynebacterium kroppenstedtii]|uniref:hypothetical protein n=1 Tax=Corynebacterium sp. PCR 32 TaxID=3351342 RepID=UPI0030B7E8B8